MIRRIRKWFRSRRRRRSSPLKGTILVLAGNHHQFWGFIRDYVPKERIVCVKKSRGVCETEAYTYWDVSTYNGLAGAPQGTLMLLYGTWRERKDELWKTARAYGIVLAEVSERWPWGG